MNLNVGDRFEEFVYLKGMTGVAIEVKLENLNNSIIEHGFVTVRLDPRHIGVFPCSPTDEEHYVHYR